VLHSVEDVYENSYGLVGAPNKAAGEEGEEEHDAIVELDFGASKVELVAKPMNIEEGGGELVEDEGRAVEVQEGSL